MSFMAPVYAETFQDTIKGLGSNIGTQSEKVSEDINKSQPDGETDVQSITLPTYQDDSENGNAYGEGGIKGITGAILHFWIFSSF